jgi:multidrug efflux pump subunit AcrA (membrane-fusion protein)
MKRFRIFFTVLVITVFVLTACGPQATQAPATEAPTEVMTEAPTEAPTEAATEAPTEAATEAPATVEATITPTLGPPAGDVAFFSTQFNVVEESEKFRAILK